MSGMTHVRARVADPLAGEDRASPRPALQQTDLATVAQHMFVLMMRNVTSDGFVLVDPQAPGRFSAPGCVIAAPSFPANTPGVDQDYVYNWVRDAAIAAMEIAAARVPPDPGGGVPALIDYVTFARLCQTNAPPTLGHACFTIGGEARPWTEQSDGPALMTLAILAAFGQLDAPTQAVARTVIAANLGYLLGVYQQDTFNLWEEHQGLSFFARAVQLRCFDAIAANTLGIPVPPGIAEAQTWLRSALQAHWNGSCYVSLLALPSPGNAQAPLLPADEGYDPNIDIVSASIYGAVPCTDTRLLATAAQLRRQWAAPASSVHYPINAADAALGLGPLLGRYPGDRYDGEVSNPVPGGHPWALCTCNLAELYCTLANRIEAGTPVPRDDLARPFWEQIGVGDDAAPAAAIDALRGAGEAMLRAVVYHGDRFELSEQFDGSTGYERSVRNLTWSYAAFLSAVRARTGAQAAG